MSWERQFRPPRSKGVGLIVLHCKDFASAVVDLRRKRK
jgi:hypothetical protein